MCVEAGRPENMAAANDLTFIGTVVDIAEGGPGAFVGPTRYAFEVERASARTDAVVVVTSATNSSCGAWFGMGERWLVGADGGSSDLETTLCSGSQRADAMDAAELAAFVQLLDHVTPEPDGPTTGGSLGWDLAGVVVVAALAVIGLGGVTLLVVRGSRRERAT